MPEIHTFEVHLSFLFISSFQWVGGGAYWSDKGAKIGKKEIDGPDKVPE